MLGKVWMNPLALANFVILNLLFVMGRFEWLSKVEVAEGDPNVALYQMVSWGICACDGDQFVCLPPS